MLGRNSGNTQTPKTFKNTRGHTQTSKRLKKHQKLPKTPPTHSKKTQNTHILYIINRYMLTTYAYVSSKKNVRTIHSTYLMFSYLSLELTFIWNARVYILRRLVLIILSYFYAFWALGFLQRVIKRLSVRYINRSYNIQNILSYFNVC